MVEIGDCLACCFKVGLHHHDCALELYQVAATDVGEKNRDVFTMGVRTITQLNSLGFGGLFTHNLIVA